MKSRKKRTPHIKKSRKDKAPHTLRNFEKERVLHNLRGSKNGEDVLGFCLVDHLASPPLFVCVCINMCVYTHFLCMLVIIIT